MAEQPYDPPFLPDTPPLPPGYIIDPVTGLPVPDPQPSDVEFAPGQDLPPGYRQPTEPAPPPPVETPVIVPPSNLPDHIERPEPDEDVIEAADGEISEASPIDRGVIEEGEVAMGGGLNVNVQGVLDMTRELGGDGNLPPDVREAVGSVRDTVHGMSGQLHDLGERLQETIQDHQNDEVYEASPAEVHDAEVADPVVDDDPYDTDQ